MKLLKGKPIADKILKDLKDKIKKEKIKPALAVFLVGENEASEIYVRLKKKAAKKIGMYFFVYRFKSNAQEKKIISRIGHLNRNPRVSGIIVQLPLPDKLDADKIIGAIDPKKDVDGFHPGNRKLLPVFPQAILEILNSTKSSLKNKSAVILANSQTFGEKMKEILQKEKIKAEFTLGLKKNKLKTADIIISAVGKAEIIKGAMLKTGAIVIDGGITKKGKKVLGDVDFESVKEKVSFITPVPGGVGPVTIACLLRNVYLASKK